MYYSISYRCINHIGKARRINQDNFICNGVYSEDGCNLKSPLTGSVTSKTPSLFGIFDGMGGEECGEIAALIAAKTASEVCIGEDAVSDLSDFCNIANKRICDYAQENMISSMGTTAAMLAFLKKDILLCNIGDSKVFRFSDDRLEQISYDHVAIGVYGRKPPLSQNLGIPPDVMVIDPFFSKGHYCDGDIYLICSDGLTDMVSLIEIESMMRDVSFDALEDKLLKKALDNGGKDNITIVICKVEKKYNGFIEFFRHR